MEPEFAMTERVAPHRQVWRRTDRGERLHDVIEPGEGGVSGG